MSDALIYGLADPRISDVYRRIRYIGQTRNGLERPKSHLRVESALKNDNNLHKANWIQSVRDSGLEPEIVILEEINDLQDQDNLLLSLGEAERRLELVYRANGAELLNVRECGSIGYRLSDEEKRKISENRSWQPIDKGRALSLDIIEEPWTRTKAWWLGITFSRVTVKVASERRALILDTNDLSIIDRWKTILGAEDYPTIKSQGTYYVEIGKVTLVRWLSDTYGIHLKWEEGLKWPADLPESFVYDFLRGIWDCKAYMDFQPREERGPVIRTSIESASWSEDFVESAIKNSTELTRFSSGSRSRRGRESLGLAVRGSNTVAFLKKLYKDAPDTAYATSQRERALNIISAAETYETKLPACTECERPKANPKTKMCRWCARRKNKCNL